MDNWKPIYIYQFERRINDDAENIYHSKVYCSLEKFFDVGIMNGTLNIDEYFYEPNNIGTVVVTFISPTIESERLRILKSAEEEFYFNFKKAEVRNLNQIGQKVKDKEMRLKPKEKPEIDLDALLNFGGSGLIGNNSGINAGTVGNLINRGRWSFSSSQKGGSKP